MKTIVTFTVVDERIASCPTQSKCIDGNKIILRLGAEFVAIPFCEKMPLYLKRGNNTFYKLETNTDGSFEYKQEWCKPRANARMVKVEELWEEPKSREQRDKLSEARAAIGTLIKHLLWVQN